MKERPILFSAPMVRALLAGTKTQTRRALKPQPSEFVGGPGVTLRDGSPAPLIALDDSVEPYGREIACPYGKPGDRLWVRETFGHFERNENFKPDCEVFYRADGNCLELEPWRPSIHMPRWASRITLEITSVRVERLQAISNDDIKAEGLDDDPRIVSGEIEGSMLTPLGRRIAFESLWESINGPASWDANPWVWVIKFRKVP